MRRGTLIAALLAATAAGAQDTAPPPRADIAGAVASAPGAVLRGLDKVSGSVTDFDVKNGQSITFGRLEVTLSDCRYPVDDPASNAFAHLTIRATGGSDPLFDGWMVAASPALSALDDARYDVWVLRCASTS